MQHLVQRNAVWDSPEAIPSLAGNEIEKAKQLDFDTRSLLELEPTVRHFEVFDR